MHMQTRRKGHGASALPLSLRMGISCGWGRAPGGEEPAESRALTRVVALEGGRDRSQV